MDGAKKDMRFEKYLRANHFSIGHSPKAAPDHYKSIQVKSFDSKKGEYSSEPDRAKFVRETHFTVGNEGAPSITAQQTSFGTAPPPDGSAEFNRERERDLKREHWTIGENEKRDMSSSNEISFKWVQPKML